MDRYGSTHCFLSRMKIAEILHQCTLDITWFLTRPGSDSHFTGYTTRMVCYRLLITCTCLSSTNYQCLFHSHLSQRFPKCCITHHNVDKSLQLQVSICKMNHVWSGSSFVCCGSSYFFIIQSSFSYVFLWFHDDLPWFPYGFHSFHVSRCLRRLRRHDILLWTAMVPLVTDEGNVPIFYELAMGGYGSLTSKYWDLTGKTLRFLRIASFCLIEFCGGIDVLTLANYLDFYIFPTT